MTYAKKEVQVLDPNQVLSREEVGVDRQDTKTLDFNTVSR